MSDQPPLDTSYPYVRNIFIAGNTGREAIIEEHIGGLEEGISYRVKRINILMNDQGKKKYPTDLDPDESFGEVHLVLFVFDSGRITAEHKRAFDNIREHLPLSASKISALVLTGCEGKDTGTREQIVSQFRNDSLTKDIAKFMTKGIYAIGFPDPSETKEDLRKEYADDIEAGSKTLRDLAKEPIAVGTVFNKKITKVAGPQEGYSPSPSLAESDANFRKQEERGEDQTNENETLKAKVQPLEAGVEDQTNENETLKEEVKPLESGDEEQTKETGTLNAKVQTHEKRIEEQNKDIETLKKDFHTLKQEFQELKAPLPAQKPTALTRSSGPTDNADRKCSIC